MSSVLLTLFSDLADPRRDQGKMYPLAPILLFTVLSMLAGARSYRQVHAFMQTHLDRLNSGFGLSLRRAPAYSSVRFILRGLDGMEIERAFRAHAAGLADVPIEGTGIPMPVAALVAEACNIGIEAVSRQDVPALRREPWHGSARTSSGRKPSRPPMRGSCPPTQHCRSSKSGALAMSPRRTACASPRRRAPSMPGRTRSILASRAA